MPVRARLNELRAQGLLRRGEGSTPRAIGAYRILDRLGQGGMGTVYLAEQREPVRRKVAVKVIKLGMDSGQVLARFELERRALASMNHDSIAKVFDAGTTDGGQPYFVMEYVDGLTLTDYCDRGTAHPDGSASDCFSRFATVCNTPTKKASSTVT